MSTNDNEKLFEKISKNKFFWTLSKIFNSFCYVKNDLLKL
jgi:hypothetical protein